MATPTEILDSNGDAGPLTEFRLRKPPFWLISLVLVATVATFVPISFIALARFNTSVEPRIHIWQDMGNQPKYREQQASMIFADRRAARPVIEGTVSREAVVGDDHYSNGFTHAAGGAVTWFDTFPSKITVDRALLERGQNRYNIYCTACHGYDGRGNGLVNERAMQVAQTEFSNGTAWVNPANLHSDAIRARQVGHLFNSITNGIRNMGGYGPQISTADRWAIVAYVRALQLSDNAPASPDIISPEQRQNLK